MVILSLVQHHLPGNLSSFPLNHFCSFKLIPLSLLSFYFMIRWSLYVIYFWCPLNNITKRTINMCLKLVQDTWRRQSLLQKAYNVKDRHKSFLSNIVKSFHWCNFWMFKICSFWCTSNAVLHWNFQCYVSEIFFDGHPLINRQNRSSLSQRQSSQSLSMHAHIITLSAGGLHAVCGHSTLCLLDLSPPTASSTHSVPSLFFSCLSVLHKSPIRSFSFTTDPNIYDSIYPLYPVSSH